MRANFTSAQIRMSSSVWSCHRAPKSLTTLGQLTTRDLIRFQWSAAIRCTQSSLQKPIKWRGPSEPKIPVEVSAQATTFIEAVERGSVVEESGSS